MSDTTYRNWNLIQRLERRAPRPINARATPLGGIDRFIAHDYMGSAEFEWGAVPHSWRTLRGLGREGKLVRLETPFKSNKGEPFYVICSAEQDEEFVFQGIFGLSCDAYHTKEPTYMEEAMKSEVNPAHYSQRTIGWLVLIDKDRHYRQPHSPVLWFKDKDLADAVFADLSLKLGRAPETITMWEEVKFEHVGKTWTGQVIGIYENHVRVKRADGEQNVEYGQLWDVAHA